jgi:Zn-dependent protease with chaperone function
MFPLGFLQSYISRVCEYQADAFAVTYGHGENLKLSLTKLFKLNKGAMVEPDSLYSALNHSHPTL